jgi:hypothetical protein
VQRGGVRELVRQVDRGRQAVLDLLGIAIRDRTVVVGRVVIIGRRPPGRHARRGLRAKEHARRAGQRVGDIPVVERQHAVGRLVARGQRVRAPRASTRYAEVRAERAVRPAAERRRQPGRARSVAREHLHDARDGVRPVQHADGAPDDFDAVDVVE